MWRVMSLKTQFWLVTGYYYNFTSRHCNYFLHCYTFTQLTFSTLQYSHSVRSVWYSLGDCRPRTAWVATVVFKITPRHGPHGKRALYCWDVLEPFPSNGRGTDLQKTSYAITILPAYWRADCCLATSNNIRNSIVACVYSVARWLPVRCLVIHVTIYTNSVRTSQRTYYVSTTKTNRLMLFRETTLFIWESYEAYGYTL
jgi:hypothetical protein